MSRVYLLIIIAIIFTGCIRQYPKVTLINKFDQNESINLLSKGSSNIDGSALLRQRGGGIVTCAGRKVGLMPVTPYTTERMMALYKNTDSAFMEVSNYSISGFENDDPNFYKNGQIIELCDAQGYFHFKNIKPGSYYIQTEITWEVGNLPEGGWIMKKVTVDKDETKNIVLTP